MAALFRSRRWEKRVSIRVVLSRDWTRPDVWFGWEWCEREGEGESVAGPRSVAFRLSVANRRAIRAETSSSGVLEAESGVTFCGAVAEGTHYP